MYILKIFLSFKLFSLAHISLMINMFPNYSGASMVRTFCIKWLS